MQTVVMPKMGDTMEEGKILSWHKHEGDKVAKGDALAEIETDKVNIEAESFVEGVLRKILVPEGQSVPVGAPIALVGKANEPLPPEYQGGPADAVRTSIPSSSTASVSGEGAGARQAAPEVAPTAAPGRPTYAQGEAEAAPEETFPRVVDQPLTAAQAGAAGTRAQAAMAPAPRHTEYAPPGPNGATSAAIPPTVPAHDGGRIFISPIARRIAQEHHLDIGQLQGTGPGGRIIKDDVEAALASQAHAVVPAAPAISAAAAGEEYAAVPLTAMRKTIARRLQQSMQTAPHFYLTLPIDTTELARLRATVNAYTATLPEPAKVSYNDLIVKGVALALARMPQVNVSFDGEQLLFKQHINVGIAVAIEQGLIVPVIRDADKRGVLDIAREAQRLSNAARAGKLKPEEFQGGTFTVSNLGMYGIEEFTAVINPPESAILAVGAIVPTPVVVDGQVTVRDRMKVTLSVDHRALDGATGARFLQEVKRLLEAPMGLLV
jgi:pyruvate dehydrogenase E2 component (dihydrolipoamide acetyltransferase)